MPLQRCDNPGLVVLALGWCIFLFSGDSAAADRGQKLFEACKSCHEIGEGARHRVGPHLDGVIDRAAGDLNEFRYSAAMKEAGVGGLLWTRETMDEYLRKPRDFIPGNRMFFRGMPNVEERTELIEWIVRASSAVPASNRDAKTTPANEASSFTDIVMQIEGDRDYGEYLAGECVTCHQSSGHADGIPSIVGLPADYFIRALFEYKTNVRSNEVMKLRVGNLGNEEIAALAAYFGSLEPH